MRPLRRREFAINFPTSEAGSGSGSPVIGRRRLVVLTSIFVLTSAWFAALPQSAGAADDWPQILGPQRTGLSASETLLPKWPASGPDVVWSSPVGSGFSGVAVSRNRVVVFSRVGDEEVTQLLDAANGKEFWSARSPCRYQSGISSDNGPRCVPLIRGERVFVFGVEGVLRCLSMKDGKEIWRQDTKQTFSPPEGYFGVGSSPVLFQDRLIVNVGSRDNAAVVAFDAATGRELWKSFADTASYSSPVVVTVDGVDHALVVTRMNLLSLDPADGRVRFQIPFGMRGPTVNGVTPVVTGNRVFLSASYGIGAVWAEFTADSVHELWRDERLLATQYATPVQFDGNLFAVDGRQDGGSGSASLKCLDLNQQKVLWQQDGFDYGSLIGTSNGLLFLTCGGELIRFEPSATKYSEIARAGVLAATDSGYRLPALSNGILFVRDDSVLKALRVGEGQ